MRYSAIHIFSPCAKLFFCSTINAFVISLEGCLGNLRKRTESRGKSFSKVSFCLRGSMELKKGQKQGKNERMQEDYRTFAE